MNAATAAGIAMHAWVRRHVFTRFRRSSVAVYEVFKGSDALCARRNLSVGGWGGLNHAWNYLGVLVLTQITGDVRIALSISV